MSRQPRSIVLPAAAISAGLAAIAVSYSGTGHRPVLATVLLLAAAGGAFLPLEQALPPAIVLACFHGMVVDFFGSPGRYWKEAFVAGLAVRSVRRRRPSWLEVTAAGGIVAVYGDYVANGTSPLAAGWAAKVLLFGVATTWAVARLPLGAHTWRAIQTGLTVAVGANLVLAVWQRLAGVNRLLDLGYTYGDRLRQAPGGAVRTFGGFTGTGAFALTLALALLAWAACLGGEPGARRGARETAWLPLAAALGISLSGDRVPLVCLGVAMALVGLREVRRPEARILLGLAPLLLGAILLVAGVREQRLLTKELTPQSDAAKIRRAFWPEYARKLTAFGTGPGSAGAAFRASESTRDAVPITFGSGWDGEEHGAEGTRFRWMKTRSVLAVGTIGHPHGPLTISFRARSLQVERRLTIRNQGRVIAAPRISPTVNTLVALRLRGSSYGVKLHLVAQPPAQRASLVTPGDPRVLAVRVTDVHVLGPGLQPPALRIFTHVERGNLAPSILATAAPGFVGNLYLSWLYQYGIVVGGLLCAAWILMLLWPLRRLRAGQSLLLTGRLWGTFLVLAALVLEVWEEFPVDLLVGLVAAHLVVTIDNNPSEGKRDPG